MIDVLRFVVGLACRRAGLVAENVLLRQQLIAAQRKIADLSDRLPSAILTP